MKRRSVFSLIKRERNFKDLFYIKGERYQGSLIPKTLLKERANLNLIVTCFRLFSTLPTPNIYIL